MIKKIMAPAAALQSVAVSSTSGNDIVATLSITFFQLFISPPFTFLMEGLLESKSYFVKVDQSGQN